MKDKDKIEIDVVQMLKVLWKRKLFIALADIVAGAIAFAYSSLSTLLIEIKLINLD